MTTDVAKVFMKYMARRPSPASFVVWTHAGRKIAQREPAHSAFWRRKALFCAEIKATWESDRPQDLRTNAEWAYRLFDELARTGKAQSAYLNYIDPLEPDWLKHYYGDNFDRLVKVRQNVDPDGVLPFNRGLDRSGAHQPWHRRWTCRR